VCKGWARGSESDTLWRLQYARRWPGSSEEAKKKEEGNEGKGVEGSSAPAPTCAESSVVCVEGKSTSWRKRFARRSRIDLNWKSGGDASRFESHTFSGHTANVNCLVVWWERGLVISCSQQNGVRAFSLETGQCLRVLEGHPAQVRCLAGDEKQDLVASGSWDKSVRLWKVSTGQCLHTLAGHTSGVGAVALLPGKVIVSGDGAGQIRVWDGEEGKLVTTMTGGGTSFVKCLTSDGKRLFSGDSDGAIRLFDMGSGTCTEVLFRASREVMCLVNNGRT
jgi:WD40 repeat protein